MLGASKRENSAALDLQYHELQEILHADNVVKRKINSRQGGGFDLRLRAAQATGLGILDLGHFRRGSDWAECPEATNYGWSVRDHLIPTAEIG